MLQITEQVRLPKLVAPLPYSCLHACVQDVPSSLCVCVCVSWSVYFVSCLHACTCLVVANPAHVPLNKIRAERVCMHVCRTYPSNLCVSSRKCVLIACPSQAAKLCLVIWKSWWQWLATAKQLNCAFGHLKELMAIACHRQAAELCFWSSEFVDGNACDRQAAKLCLVIWKSWW